MNKLGRILLGRLIFLRVEFLPEGGQRITTYLWQRGSFTPAEEAEARKYATAVVFCGQGIITKPAGTEIVARVVRDGANFRWSETAGRVSFVRRSQTQPLFDELTQRGVVPVWTGCAEASEEFGPVADEAAQQFFDKWRWRDLFRVSEEASATAQALTRRLAPFLLGGFLLLLVGNFLGSSSLAARHAELEKALAVRAQAEERTEAADGRRRQLLEAFAARRAMSYAVLCDRIAAAVPEKVTLTSLEAEPLSKRFETGKPLQRREGIVVVRGIAPDPGAVAGFTDGLTALRFADMRLLSVEKEREGKRLLFSLELTL